MLSSPAKHFGRDLTAVILTGMGDDGRLGVQAVAASGGAVIAESEETAVIFGMPQQAIETGAVDAILPLSEIAPALEAGVPAEQQIDQKGSA
jgi:two-component system chemotaxis response regulator CheB